MSRKVIIAAVLWAVLAMLVVYGLRKWGSGDVPPPAVLAREATLIDLETLELITLTSAEWMELGKRGLLYKHPKTGEYTVSMVMKCASCGKLIPWVASDNMQPCPRCGGAVME